MIAFLRGRILDKQPNRIIVDVQGVGYEVHVPLSTYYDVGDEGTETALRVHTHVREESLQLYGFLTTLEQQLFERLIAISGIGPKLAISVLSGIEPGELVSAVQRADVARLTGIPGIGRKTAERIVLELKDRLAQLAVPVPANLFEYFVQACVTPFVHPAELIKRAELLRPLYRVKWCCIALNVFLPVHIARRKFADPYLDETVLKRAQLAKAYTLYQSLEASTHGLH